MREVEWQKLASFSPENLNDDDLSFLYNFFCSFDSNESIDTEYLSHLLNLALEVLKFKGEEAEVYAIDNNKLTSLLREKDTSLNEGYGIHSGGLDRFADGSNLEDLRQRLVQTELQNDQLVSDLKARDLQISHDRKEYEKLSGQVLILERENMELRREVASLHDETNERSIVSESHSISPEVTAEKQKELINSIREKNKHISQLLNDIEMLEKENKTLREKLTSVRNDLSDATTQLIELTGELRSLKCSSQEREEKLSTLEDQNSGLKNQVEELVRQKNERDSQLDDFASSIDSRIQEWKNILEKKDALIEELQSRISEFPNRNSIVHNDAEDQQLKVLAETLQRREDQIEQLQTQLHEATKEINDSAALIEKLKQQKLKSSETPAVDTSTTAKMETQIRNAEGRIDLLEKKLQDAEDDAKLKAEEVTDMIVLLREYEAGEYGLAEAVTEMKALRRQCKVRERETESAVQSANHLQATVSRLEEQNLALRKKLNLPPDESVSVNDAVNQFKQEQTLVKKMQMQTERLEEEKVHLRIENRRLVKRVQELTQLLETGDNDILDDKEEKQSKESLISTNREVLRLEGPVEDSSNTQLVPVSGLRYETTSIDTNRKYEQIRDLQLASQKEVEKLKEQLQEFITENEALRRGMHEILDSIKNQDASSDVQINSHCLERLLEALDVRHVSGWYHPAMRLQAQLQLLEGKNSILREQLRDSRLEERRLREECEQLLFRMTNIEAKQSPLILGGESVIRNESVKHPASNVTSNPDMVAKLNGHLLNVLNDNMTLEETNKMLESKLESLGKKYSMVRHEVGLLYKEYAAAKEEWQKLLKEATEKEEKAVGAVKLLRAQVAEMQRVDMLMASLASGDGEGCNGDGDGGNGDEQRQTQMATTLQESARRLLDAQLARVAAEHKCEVLQASEDFLRKRCDQMAKEMGEMECSVMKALGDFQRQKGVADYQIDVLQRRLDDSIPADIFDAVNKTLSDLNILYKNIQVEQQESDDPVATLLGNEIEQLHKDKTNLITDLQNALKRLHYLEETLDNKVLTNDNNVNHQISSLANKLAAAEINAVKEMQRADFAEDQLNVYKRHDKEAYQVDQKLSNGGILNCIFFHICECGELESSSDSLNEELKELRNEVNELRNHKNELLLEKQKLQEISDIAQEQVRSLELWKLTQDCQLQTFRQQMLDLLDDSDEKLAIARLNQELLTAKLNETMSAKKVQHASNEIKKLQMHFLNQEMKINEERKNMNNFKNKITKRFRCVCLALHALAMQTRALAATAARGARERRSGAGERRALALCVRDARRAAAHAQGEADALRRQMDETVATREEGQCDDDRELRLKEMKLTRRLEVLETQCQQTENRIIEQEEILSNLEEEHMKILQDWEQVGNQWKQFKEESDDVISLYRREPKHLSCNAATITDMEAEKIFESMSQSTHHEQDSEIMAFETENKVIKQFIVKVNSLTQQLLEKDSLLSSKSLIIKELKAQIMALQNMTFSTYPIEVDKTKELETADKIALKATVSSLQKILIQKEDTINRYQTLLKDCRDENGRTVAQLQEQLRSVQSSLCDQISSATRSKTSFRRRFSEQNVSVSEEK